MPPFHCLVVSGSPERRRMMEGMLRASGHVVLPTISAGEVGEAIASSDLEILVLDLSLPLLDRPALQRALRPTAPTPPDSLESAERRHIAMTLEFTGGNRREAARILGIARSTMLAKLRKYGLEAIS